MSIGLTYKILDAIRKRVVLCVAVLLFSVSSGYAANRYSVATGNWNNNNTWSATSGGGAGASFPVAGDVVYLETGFTVTVTADAVCTSITFTGANATLTVNSGFTVTVSGAVTLNSLAASDTDALISGTGSLSCASVQVGTDGNPGNNRTRVTTITSTITSFTISGNLTLSSFIGTSNRRIINSTFQLENGILNLSGTITTINENAVNVSTLSMATGSQSGTLNLSAATPFNLTGTGTSTITLNGTNALVNYNRANTQTGFVTTYTNLTLSGTSAKTFATTPTVDGILSMEGDATITVTTGVVTYGGSATLQYNSANPRTVSSEEWLTPFAATGGVIIANTGTITLNQAKVFNASVPLTINNGATLATNNLQLTLGGNFVNGGTLTAGSSPIVIANTMVAQSIGGFTTTGAVSMTKTAGTATATGNINGAGITINGTGGTLNLGAGLTHTFTGDWTRTNGTLNGGSSLLKIGGNVSGTGGTFTAGTGTVEWYAAGDQSVADVTYNNLTISGSGNKTIAGNVIVNGTLTLTAGTFSVGANTLTLNGPTIAGTPTNLATTSSSSLVLGGTSANVLIPTSVTALNGLSITNSSVVTLQSSPTVSGTFNPGGAGLSIGANTLTLNGQIDCGTLLGGASSNITIDGSGSASLSAVTLNNLTVNRAVTMCGSVTVGGAATFTSGALVLNGNTLNLNGTTSVTGGTITGSATSSVAIASSNDAGMTLPNITVGLQNFTINKTGATNTVALGGNLTVSGAATFTSGVLNLVGNTLNLNGTTAVTSGTIHGSPSSSVAIASTNAAGMITSEYHRGPREFHG